MGESVVQFAFHEEYFKTCNYSIIGCEAKDQHLQSIDETVQYIRDILAKRRREVIIDTLLDTTYHTGHCQRLWRRLGLDKISDLHDHISTIVVGREIYNQRKRKTIHLTARAALEALKLIPEVRDWLGHRSSIDYKANRLILKQAIDTANAAPIFKVLRLQGVIDARTKLEEFYAKLCASHNQDPEELEEKIDVYLDEDKLCWQPFLDDYLYERPITTAEMDLYLDIGNDYKRCGWWCNRRNRKCNPKSWTFRPFIRGLLYVVTAKNSLIRSSTVGLEKLWFVFGLLYANEITDFLQVHIHGYAQNLTDDWNAIWSGFQKLCVSIGLILLLAFLVYEPPRMYRHIPRMCRRDSKVVFDTALAEMARRNRQTFTRIIARDVKYDPEAPNYEQDYDSENDDPYVAKHYFHMEESDISRPDQERIEMNIRMKNTKQKRE